jgi:hypothetical protein
MAEKSPRDRDNGPKLERRDVWALIWATYKTLLPRVLLFALVFLLITWLITEVLF